MNELEVVLEWALGKQIHKTRDKKVKKPNLTLKICEYYVVYADKFENLD